MAKVLEITELPRFSPRPSDSHKGMFGRVLVVAGSRGMSGAAILCSSAALRGGAGLVTAAVPESTWHVVAAGNPCAMTLPLINDGHGRLAIQAVEPLLHEAEKADVVVFGPGIGQAPSIQNLVTAFVSRCPKPMVIDADGLNGLGPLPSVLQDRKAPTVLTPHPAEFGRLNGTDTSAVQRDREAMAARFAEDYHVIVALKGHRTIVTDGQRIYRNTTGNPGLATAGAGDVLTGLIGALVGQWFEPFAAAQLGVYLHGFAGDLARDDIGEVAMIASDLLTYLPKAIQRHSNSKS